MWAEPRSMPTASATRMFRNRRKPKEETMKLAVHYEPSGKVRSFVAVGGTDSNGMMLVPTLGALVAEVEDVSLESGVAGGGEVRGVSQKYIVQPSRKAPEASS